MMIYLRNQLSFIKVADGNDIALYLYNYNATLTIYVIKS